MIDLVVFSPPYSRMLTGEPTEKDVVKLVRQRPKHQTPGRKAADLRLMEGYSMDTENIGNLPHGCFELITFSPTYSETGLGGEGTTVEETHQALKRAGMTEEQIEAYWRRHAPTSGQQYKGDYTKGKKDKGNVGTLKHGNMDIIVTSPPYSETGNRPGRDLELFIMAMKRNGLSDEQIDKHITQKKGIWGGEWDKEHLTTKETIWYSPDGKNVGNLRHGEIDAAIMSPPYADQINRKAEDMQRILEKMRKELPPEEFEKKSKAFLEEHQWGKSQDAGYSDDPNNVANRKYGKMAVDNVVASPPYSESLSNLRKGRSEDKQQIEKEKGLELHEYGSEDNIGNLQHGKFEKVTELIVSREKIEGLVSKLKLEGEETYLSSMLQIYFGCQEVLKPHGCMALVVKNFIRDKKVFRLDIDTIKLCLLSGMIHEDTIMHKLEPSFWRLTQFTQCDHVSFPRWEELEIAGLLQENGGHIRIAFWNDKEEKFVNFPERKNASFLFTIPEGTETPLWLVKSTKEGYFELARRPPTCKVVTDSGHSECLYYKVKKKDVGFTWDMMSSKCPHYINTAPKLLFEHVLIFRKPATVGDLEIHKAQMEHYGLCS